MNNSNSMCLSDGVLFLQIDALPCNLQQLYYDDGTEEYRSCEMICDPSYEDIDLVLCNTVCAGQLIKVQQRTLLARIPHCA